MAKRDHGVASTEVALLMPVIILLSLLPIQWALWWFGRQSAEAAAEHCVDQAQQYGGGDGAGAASAIVNNVGNLTDVSITVSVGGETATCDVSARLSFTILMNPGISATASGPVERLTDG